MFLKSKFICLLVLVMLSFSRFARAVQHSISSGRSVEAQADTLFEMIQKALSYTKKDQDKFKQVNLVLLQLKQLKNIEEASPEQREYVDKYIVALETLPNSRSFKKSKCNSYQVEENVKKLLDGLCK